MNTPSFNRAVVLATGANGGIGTEFVYEAFTRGASKVYATARNPRTWDDDRIVPLTLDVIDPASIHAVVEAAGDVTVLINDADPADLLGHGFAPEVRSNGVGWGLVYSW